jgi:hypothetical protein
MPYGVIEDFPPAVQNLPVHAQGIFRAARGLGVLCRPRREGAGENRVPSGVGGGEKALPQAWR